MSYLNKSLIDIIEALKNKQVSAKELVEESLLLANKYSKYNPFVTILGDTKGNSEAPLYGVPYALKDNFSTKDILTTGSSNILKDYIPVFDATVVEKLKESGATLIGKTVLDELAMGGTGMSGHTGRVYNPYDPSLNTISGGSSAGSAVAVALGIVPFAIGSDTGDSVRKPAAHCGIVGIKPTYGRISRYGLFPFATSIDHVAYFTRTVRDSAFLLSLLEGSDNKDATASTREGHNYLKDLNTDVKGKKIAIISEIVDCISEPSILSSLDNAISIYKEGGATVERVSVDLNLLRAILPVYMIISCSEATSNNAGLDGINFTSREEGNDFEEVMINSRSKGLGKFVKNRLVLGAYCLDNENIENVFIKAQKVRSLITETINNIFKDYDAILLPASADAAPTFDKLSDRMSDEYIIGENHLAIANLGGFPSLTLPYGFKGNLPLGVNLTCKAFDEQTLFNLSAYLESKLPYENMIAKEEEK